MAFKPLSHHISPKETALPEAVGQGDLDLHAVLDSL
jgi:hypothetical protein